MPLWRSAKAAWLTGTGRPRKATHVMRSGSKRKHQRKVQTRSAQKQQRAARVQKREAKRQTKAQTQGARAQARESKRQTKALKDTATHPTGEAEERGGQGELDPEKRKLLAVAIGVVVGMLVVGAIVTAHPVASAAVGAFAVAAIGAGWAWWFRHAPTPELQRQRITQPRHWAREHTAVVAVIGLVLVGGSGFAAAGVFNAEGSSSSGESREQEAAEPETTPEGGTLPTLAPVAENQRGCSDFATHEEAQAFFEEQGGPDEDPHVLDFDDDGQACERLATEESEQLFTPPPTEEPAQPHVSVGDAGVTAVYPAEQEFSARSFFRDTFEETRENFPRWVQEYPDAPGFRITWKMTFQNEYGEERVGDGAEVFMTRPVAERIQWSNMSAVRLYDLADNDDNALYYLAPVILREIDDLN